MPEEYTCPRDGQIEPYLDGTLVDTERQVFEDHLKVCKNCQEGLELAHRVDEVLMSMEEVHAPTWLAQRVIARARQIAPDAEKSHSWLGWLGGLLVGFSLCALLVYLIMMILGTPSVVRVGAETAQSTAQVASGMLMSQNTLIMLAGIPVCYGIWKAAQVLGLI